MKIGSKSRCQPEQFPKNAFQRCTSFLGIRAKLIETVLLFQIVNIYRVLDISLKWEGQMGTMRRELADKIRELIGADADLRFLLRLEEKELETLIASIRERPDRAGQ